MLLNVATNRIMQARLLHVLVLVVRKEVNQEDVELVVNVLKFTVSRIWEARTSCLKWWKHAIMASDQFIVCERANSWLYYVASSSGKQQVSALM